ncbi:MAG: hypothetical protein Q7S61_03760 [bacterium]|nr:hypothetical protein [bacterium]
MKKALFLVSVLFLSASIFPVEAKLLPQSLNTPKKSVVAAPGGVVVSPRLRQDRKALILYLNNLSKANSVTYTLMYQTNGKDEGVSGTITSSSGNATSRELLFGTCSSGVCRYHTNITNMKLEVAIELISGKTIVKKYRVKI